MRIQNRTVGYAAIQGFFWMCYAAIMGFVSVYLLDRDFDNRRIGVIIAAAGLLSAAVQPILAGYADRPGNMSLRKILLLASAVPLVCSVGLAVFRDNAVMTGLLYGTCIVLLQMTTPLVNSLGVATVNSGETMNFGAARGIGSMGYAAGAYVIGLLAEYFGAVVVPMSILAAYGLFLLATALYGELPETRTEASGKNTADTNFFRRYPRYMQVLGGCVMLFISHVVLNNFTYQIVVAKGGGSEEMGIAMAFASAIELPIMFLFGWMQKKARCDFWFRISGIFFMLKCLGTLLCTDMPGFYAAQIFQMGGWALITVSSVFYINAIMAPEDTVKGQAYYTVSMTLGNVVGAILCGRILDSLGVQAMLLFGTICGAIGAVILLICSEKAEPEHG